MAAAKFRRRSTTNALPTVKLDKDTDLAQPSFAAKYPLRPRLSTSSIPITTKEEGDSSCSSMEFRERGVSYTVIHKMRNITNYMTAYYFLARVV